MAGVAQQPPRMSFSARSWLRENLFGTWANSLLTVVVGFLIFGAVLLGTQWALEARWGAITNNLRLFLIGRYPFEEAWRIWLSLAAISLLAGLSAGRSSAKPIRTVASWLAGGQIMVAALAVVSAISGVVVVALLVSALLLALAFMAALRFPPPTLALAIGWLIWLPATMLLLQGGGGVLPLVNSSEWGGLTLTLLLAIGAIGVSFPFGVLLALGRRSDMLAVRLLSTVYIEVIRGVPLVTLLFIGAIMLPLFLPGGVRPDQIYRAMVALTVFSAAYVAENVRGGLQAIPTGQIEAARAIGLNTVQMNIYIVLPQALRSVIPANVGLFISLLKDTTLVAIAGSGLAELLGVSRQVLAQQQWIGAQREVYIFISVIFFVLCYTMSQASYRLEEALGVGKR
jgi:general L-amino acid transport system permease protein